MKYGLGASVLFLAFLSAPIFAQEASKEKAEAVFLKSCGFCHDSSHRLPLVPDGVVDWDLIQKNADEIVKEVQARKMPPPRAPATVQITDEERADLIAYVKTLINPPVTTPANVHLDRLTLPQGFSIEVLASVPGARSIAVHESGIIFVGTGAPTAESGPKDTVYALVPDAKGHPKVITFMKGLNAPNGVALRGDDLYVAEATRVIHFADAITTAKALADGSQKEAPEFDVIKDDFTQQTDHYWKYLAIGPDDKIYVPIGANCNVCLADDRGAGAGIFRMNIDGTGFEQIAKGVRNTVGFDWDPATQELWFTDNGRDLLGDDIPSDELNHLTAPGSDFGFPYCFAKSVVDPKFGVEAGFSCNEPQFTKPEVELGAHVASLGMTFYRGDKFPALYKNQAFVAEHGSWNRTKKSGYRIRVVQKDASGNLIDNAFISGWLDDATQEDWGRPVDVKTYTDGSLLISDDSAGVLYRVSYKASTTN